MSSAEGSPADLAAITKPPSALMESARSFFAGGIGGICAVVTGHPFDLVKVRLQTSQPGVYTSALDAAKKAIVRDGPIRGLYAGVSAPLLGVTPMFAVSFWGYDMGKQLVRLARGDESLGTSKSRNFTIGEISAAGFFSAIPMTAITAPFERVKVLLQLQESGKKQYSGTWDVVRQLYRTGGVKSVFRGSTATLARDGPGSAAYFATYEYIKRRLSPESGELSLWAVSFAGGAAGVSMWLLVFPVDTVKSRLQGSKENKGLGQVVKEVYRAQGVKGFFPGLGPALMRSFPANAATFVGVELAYRAWDRVF